MVIRISTNFRGAFVHICDHENLKIVSTAYPSETPFHLWWYGDTIQGIATLTPKGFDGICRTTHFRGYRNLLLDLKDDMIVYLSRE